jgi:trehalose/maltose hydrolase-like predicted phosphorylase/beta-phosphoglucomutase-like phosphatase (HAD superfamily)
MDMWKGAVFELHAVVSGTPELQFESWKRSFDEILGEIGEGKTSRPFDYEDDYLPYVYRRPRYVGVRAFLESRDIHLPNGHPSDPPDRRTVCGIANRKNELFRELLSERGVRPAGAAVDRISAFRGEGIGTAVVSTSRNCRAVLEAAGLLELFDVVIDGKDVMELSLPVRPEPDAFELACENLQVRAGESLLAEAAPDGVEAGRRGNFGLVVGVASDGNEDTLRERGADLTVADIGELTAETVRTWFAEGREEDAWHLVYRRFAPEEEMLREALTTVGNGYIGSRGAYCGAVAYDDIHYPGTYVAGLWNTLGTEVHGRTIYNNDFVNIPNWLLIELKIGEGSFCRILSCSVESYEHSLDMRAAVTSRRLVIRDRAGHRTRIETRRFVSMSEPHLAAIEFAVTPLNYDKPVTLKSTLDGTVVNYGVPRYRDLSKRHLDGVEAAARDGRLELHTRTTESAVDIHVHARHTVSADGEALATDRDTEHGRAYVSEVLRFTAEEGRTYTLRKYAGIYTSRDRDSEDPAADARALVDHWGSGHERFEQALRDHRRRWAELWDRADMRIDPDRFSQRVLRLHAYHLLATHSPNSVPQDVGLTARGLHGEAYRGHIFWDELFVTPFYNLRFPDVTRGHLLYRYRRLDAARELARAEGYRGAMYPWQSADDGGEESQVLHYNPRSGEWDPDLSRNQRHISLAIAYDAWSYYYATGDAEFMRDYGMEMLLEICRFWVSRATYDEADGRYHIAGVMGPDEFHEKYPDATEGGLRDNAYTNIMTAWILHKTIETWQHQPRETRAALADRIGFDERRELERWQQIISRLAVVMDEDGIIAQFAGYHDLAELDWEDYRRRYDNIRRMDRILKAEGDSPDRYQVAKQADALMIFYLLSPGQVKHTLELMGYEVGDERTLATRNYEYYLARTSHGSTLSYIVHSAISRYVEGHRNDTWRWFMEGLRSDIFDTQGGTTREAIHCGVMAGTLDIVVENFAGINLFRDRIVVNPDLPRGWDRLAFTLVHRDNLFRFEIVPGSVRVSREALGADGAGEMTIQVGGQTRNLGDEPLEIPYEQKSARMPS